MSEYYKSREPLDTILSDTTSQATQSKFLDHLISAEAKNIGGQMPLGPRQCPTGLLTSWPVLVFDSGPSRVTVGGDMTEPTTTLLSKDLHLVNTLNGDTKVTDHCGW